MMPTLETEFERRSFTPRERRSKWLQEKAPGNQLPGASGKMIGSIQTYLGPKKMNTAAETVMACMSKVILSSIDGMSPTVTFPSPSLVAA